MTGLKITMNASDLEEILATQQALFDALIRIRPILEYIRPHGYTEAIKVIESAIFRASK